MKPSPAAYRRVCFPIAVKQAVKKALVAAILLLTSTAALSAQAPVERHPQPQSPSDKRRYLMSESLDLVTLETNTEDNLGQAGAQNSQGQTFVIQRIEFIGNRRVRNDTLKARIFSRDGDTYNEETLRRDFQALWNTQFFEDVKLRVEDSPDRANSKIIIFEVKERPVIRRIRYDGIHSISESDILDRFKERKVGLTVESQFDPTKIKKAQVVLGDLLGEHGRQFAKITPQYERIASSNAVILIFKIDEGPKVKVGKIKFTGNHAFSDRKLIRAMRNDRPYGIPLYITFIPVMSKTYDHDKLVEDIEVGIRGMYQDNGYFRVLVKDPIIENIDTRDNRLGVPLVLGKSNGKAVNITIPIEEGERYKMGTLKIVSADPDKQLSLKVEALKSFFPLKQGDILNVDRLRKALKEYTSQYGRFGFIDFTAEPEFDIDDANKIINLTLRFDEQKQYYVRRIEFSGNTTTRDKVIRRELLIDEGSLFDKRAWEISILRLNQLDYFDRIEADKAVEIKRNTKESTVDLNLKLKEKGKQSIGLNGGVSGLAGGFIGLTYQTNNFLGLGETLTFSAQFGSLQRSFLFGFTEPYLFDRPISSGFTIFSSRYSYDQAKQESLLFGQNVSINPQFIQNYNQNSTGFTVFASYPLRKFSFTRVGVTYGLTRTNITAFNDASRLLFQSIQYRSFAGPSALDGIVSSTVTPTITYNSVDNPVNPTTGKSWLYTAAFTGGPLGGNVNTLTNVLEYKQFRPVNKHRNVFGYRARVAYITGFGGKQIPPYNRFYMGGEDDLRGYDIRSISPVSFIPTATTLPVPVGSTSVPVQTLIYTATLPGADAQAFGNVEYRIPIVKTYFQTAFFFDGGTSGVVNRNGLKLNSAALSGNCTAPPFSLTCPNQFPDAKLTASLPIAAGTNFRLRGSAGIEFVIQLPIVQAPFRIYYAYNVHRLRETLVAQNPFLEPTQFCEPAGTINPLLPTPCPAGTTGFYPSSLGLGSTEWFNMKQYLRDNVLNNPGRLNYFEPRTTFRFTVSRTF
ncbi:MAG: outer membrane protein assembly factor BamA [Acidobacteria bacterium]|nr:outer membrane protein assembly factor BamA [Acidobacteriota bacterium]MBS1865076.1 outer membrane protein assembly factor BamA [Acidobacteriota bacterium]